MSLRIALTRFILPVIGIALVVGGVAGLIVYTSSIATPVRLAFCIFIGTLLIFLGGYWRRRKRWGLPIRRLERAAERMARGEWDTRVEPHGAGGTQRMAGSLNAVASAAQRQLADLQQQRSGLQTLVDTLPDPILATDAQGRITLLNAPAARLLSLTPERAVRQKLVSVVSDEAIVQLYESVVARVVKTDTSTPMNREIRLARGGQRQTFQAMATMTVGGGTLMVLRDISTLAGAIQMKTDFVANAGHELRTPIAAIKIAFETLRDVYREDPVQAQRCVGVIDEHIRRLEEMLRDLLDLSRVENTDLEPSVATVKTADVLAVVDAMMGELARKKGVELVLETEPNSPAEMQTDLRLIQLILKNLVENSLKFTAPGGQVAVRIREIPAAAAVPPFAPARDVRIELSVADTGIGIAPEHLDRVFERFYQVDPSRTGSAGRGTGLGLAIVKHAVHALGGTVWLESKVGVGTTVTCELPRRQMETVET